MYTQVVHVSYSRPDYVPYRNPHSNYYIHHLVTNIILIPSQNNLNNIPFLWCLLSARNLLRRTNPRTRGGKERRRRTRVDTEIEVGLSAVLIGHITDRVPVDGAEVVDHDGDGLLRDGVAVQIRLDGQLVAGAAGRSRALARSHAELLLADGGRVLAGVDGRVAAGVDRRGAVGRAILVAGTVLREGGFEGA